MLLILKKLIQIVNCNQFLYYIIINKKKKFKIF